MAEGGGRVFHEQIVKLNEEVDLEVAKRELGQPDSLREKVARLREVERERDAFLAELLIRLNA